MNNLHRLVSSTAALLLFAPFVALNAQTSTPAAAPAAATKLGSAVFKWEDLKVVTKASGEQRAVVNLPTATIAVFESHITTLKPGVDSHAPHRHAREELIILKEGTLEIHINGGKQRVGPGSLFLFASNDLHNVTNVGDTPATYFVFNFTTGATPPASSKPAVELAMPGKLPSTIWDWDKLVAVSNAKGARREVATASTISLAKFDCHVTTLNPGESPHAAHHHPDEELIAIKEGELEATINGVAQRAGPGGIIFFGSNTEHMLKSVGKVPAVYHVMRITTDATPAG